MITYLLKNKKKKENKPASMNERWREEKTHNKS